MPEQRPRTVLVLRFSSVGDILLCAPALESLAAAWPDASIVFVTKACFSDLARGIPNVHEVEPLREGVSLGAFRRRLRERYGPAAVLDLHGKVRSLLLRGIADRRWRVVWKKRELMQSLAVRLCRRPYRARMHIARRYHRAVERLVGRGLPRGRLLYRLNERDVEEARKLLRDRGVDLSQSVVGMSPGAMWETKRWPAERFAGLAARAIQAGCQVLLTGSPVERDVTAGIARAVPGVLDLAGALNLGTLGGVIASCKAFVANDSGPMHMARALQVPTLAFFGSTDPGQFDFSGHALGFVGLDCSPCSFHGLRRCPKGHMRCLLDQQVDTAWRSLDGLLRAGPAAAVHG